MLNLQWPLTTKNLYHQDYKYILFPFLLSIQCADCEKRFRFFCTKYCLSMFFFLFFLTSFWFSHGSSTFCGTELTV